MHRPQAAASALVLLASFIPFGNAVTCYSGVNIFTARGTGETPPTGLGIEGTHIRAVLAAIPGSNATVIDYPASTANNSVPVGVQNGTRQVEEYLDACPTSKVVIMGYSQGARVQGYVLTGATLNVNPDGSAGPYTVSPLASKYADQIVAIVFFGDPGFNIDIGTNSVQPVPCTVSSKNPRTGDLWNSYGDRLEQWCNYDDYACCATGTTLAGHIAYFDTANATITGDFVAGKYNAIGAGSGSNTTSPAASASRTAVVPGVTASRVSSISGSAYGTASLSGGVPTRPASASSAGATSTPSGTAPAGPAYTGSAESLKFASAGILGFAALFAALL